MTTYTLTFCDSEGTFEISADSDADAVLAAERLLADEYEDVVSADQWDADGTTNDDEPRKRILFWATEDDAENDAGANAIGELSTVGRA